jgi:hypothetical protein
LGRAAFARPNVCGADNVGSRKLDPTYNFN